MNDAPVAFGPFVFSLTLRKLWHAGQGVPLKPREAELLALLAERRPDAVSRDEIIERLWEKSGSEAALNQTVYRLRKALSRFDTDDYIRTHAQIGFQLTGGSIIELYNHDPEFRRPTFSHFQRAAQLYEASTEAAILEAIVELELICDADADFLQAHVLLARAYTTAGIRLFYHPPEAYWRARVRLEYVLERDRSDANALATLSLLILFFTANRARARAAAERALSLAPHLPVAYNAAVWERLSRREFHAALTQADLGVMSDPASGHFTSLVGISLYMSGQFSEALVAFDTALSLDPSQIAARFYRACALTMLNDSRGALQEVSPIDGLDLCVRAIALTGVIAAKDGDVLTAQQCITRLESMPIPADVSTSAIYLTLNDQKATERSIRRALNTREPGLFLIAVDPIYARARDLFPQLIAEIEQGRPKQCDRCGTPIAGVDVADLFRTELCFQCRVATRQRGTSHDSKAMSYIARPDARGLKRSSCCPNR